MSEEFPVLIFFLAVAGGAAGLAGGALWWALGILFGFSGPQGETEWMACAAMGAIALPIIVGIGVALLAYRDRR